MGEILLVEDDLLVAELIEEVLREHGLGVSALHSATEAVARLEAEASRFDVVVTDINLGESITGFDVAARARALNPRLQIVYVTGLPSNIYAAEEEALMFPKPFDPHELAVQVRSLLASGA